MRLATTAKVRLNASKAPCLQNVAKPGVRQRQRKRMQHLERREKLISGLDLRHAVGIEIGPLDRPIIAKQDGEVIYVDHADTASLRNKYKDDPNVDDATIVNVDAVWGAQTLQEAIGPDRKNGLHRCFSCY